MYTEHNIKHRINQNKLEDRTVFTKELLISTSRKLNIKLITLPSLKTESTHRLARVRNWVNQLMTYKEIKPHNLWRAKEGVPKPWVIPNDHHVTSRVETQQIDHGAYPN